MLRPFQKGVQLGDQATPIAGLLSQITEFLQQAKTLQGPSGDAHTEESDQYEIVDEEVDTEDDTEDEDEDTGSD